MLQLIRASVLAVLAFTFVAPATGAANDEGQFDPVHHSADGYFLDFEPFGLVELPRIFLVRRAGGGLGLDAFASTTSAVHSGKYRALSEEPDAIEEEVMAGEVDEHAAHGAGTETGPEGTEHGNYLDASLVPVSGALILDFSVTRHLVFAVLGALIVALIFISLARRYQRGVGRTTAPQGLFQNIFEILILFVRDEIAKPNLGDKYQKFLPYLLTAFFFILTCNLLGLVPFGATATSNLMLTAVLATATFLVTQISASKDHWKHVFWPPGVPTLIKPILIPVEILGLFTKPFALAIRLFANMTAGHLVILSLIGLIFSFTQVFGRGVGWGVSPVSVAFALFIFLLELLVALIQAYIFTMLSALFIGMAVEEHHHGEAGEGHLPALTSPDHAHVTPHLVAGDGAAHAERTASPEPVAAG